MTGRRSFTAAALVLVGLSSLALVGRAGGESPDTPRAEERLDGVRNALMPLLQYVREGQPRDALKELSAEAGSSIGPAAMRSIRDGAVSALANLEQLDHHTTGLPESLASVRVATTLYAEAALLGEDASQGAPAAKIELATIGGRLLRYADVLFDRARRIAGEGLPVSAVRLDDPDAIPEDEVAVRVLAEAEELAMRGDLARAGRLRAIARTIGEMDGAR